MTCDTTNVKDSIAYYCTHGYCVQLKHSRLPSLAFQLNGRLDITMLIDTFEFDQFEYCKGKAQYEGAAFQKPTILF